MNFYVYSHIRNDTGTTFYIGKGHKGRAYSKTNRNKYWHNIVNSVGYTVKILFSNLTENEAFSKEIELISYYKKNQQCEANFCPGGKGSTGYKWTEEQRDSFSKIKKGKKSGASGYKWTEEQRLKLSKSSTGKILSDVHKSRIGKSVSGEKNGFFGKKHTEEFKTWIKEKNKNSNLGGSNPASRKVIDIDSGIIYNTAKEAAASRGIVYLTLYRSLAGKTKKDYRLRYLEK